MDQTTSSRPPTSGPGRQIPPMSQWRRSTSDRHVAGVCGGLGQTFNIDPVIIRVIFAALTLTNGVGILLYAAAWVLLPEQGSSTAPVQSLIGQRAGRDEPPGRSQRYRTGGATDAPNAATAESAGWFDGGGGRTRPTWLAPGVVVALVIAIAIAVSAVAGHTGSPFPLVVIAIALFAMMKGGRRHRGSGCGRPDRPDQPGHDRPSQYPASPGQVSDEPGGESPSTGSTGSSETAGTAVTSRHHPGAPQSRSGVVWTDDDPLGLYTDEPASAPATADDREPQRRGVGPKPAVLLLTGGAMLVAQLAGAELPWVFGIGLAVLGAGMVAGGLIGRTAGLFGVGLLLAAAMLVTSVFGGAPSVGERTYAPALVPSGGLCYQLDLGKTVVDLRKATFQPGATIRVVGTAGEVRVLLPANTDVTGQARVSAGEIGVFETKSAGRDQTVPLSDPGRDNKLGPNTVNLDVRLRAGKIDLERAG